MEEEEINNSLIHSSRVYFKTSDQIFQSTVSPGIDKELKKKNHLSVFN